MFFGHGLLSAFHHFHSDVFRRMKSKLIMWPWTVSSEILLLFSYRLLFRHRSGSSPWLRQNITQTINALCHLLLVKGVSPGKDVLLATHGRMSLLIDKRRLITSVCEIWLLGGWHGHHGGLLASYWIGDLHLLSQICLGGGLRVGERWRLQACLCSSSI